MKKRGGGQTSFLSAKAFTLAEVLVTLGIIGVVAAMTMPTLVAKYQEKATVTKLKKMYSVLTQAYNTYKIDNTPQVFGYDEEGAIQTYNVFKPYLKVAKDCGTESASNGCFYVKGYKKLDGDSVLAIYGINNKYYKVLLADGSSVLFRGGDYSYSNNQLMEVFYDVNGEAPPNTWGKDLFEFDIYADKLVPNGHTKEEFERYCFSDGGKYEWGSACTAWVIYNENMDYLKCPEKLSWDGKKKCN